MIEFVIGLTASLLSNHISAFLREHFKHSKLDSIIAIDLKTSISKWRESLPKEYFQDGRSTYPLEEVVYDEKRSRYFGMSKAQQLLLSLLTDGTRSPTVDEYYEVILERWKILHNDIEVGEKFYKDKLDNVDPYLKSLASIYKKCFLDLSFQNEMHELNHEQVMLMKEMRNYLEKIYDKNSFSNNAKHDYIYLINHYRWKLLKTEDNNYYDAECVYEKQISVLEPGLTYYKQGHRKTEATEPIKPTDSTAFIEYKRNLPGGVVRFDKPVITPESIQNIFYFDPPAVKNEEIHFQFNTKFTKFKCRTKTAKDSKNKKVAANANVKNYERVGFNINHPTRKLVISMEIPQEIQSTSHFIVANQGRNKLELLENITSERMGDNIRLSIVLEDIMPQKYIEYRYTPI